MLSMQSCARICRRWNSWSLRSRARRSVSPRIRMNPARSPPCCSSSVTSKLSISFFYSELQQKKEIESFEVTLLEQHGGDLAGFILIRGETERLARLRNDQEFQRLQIRAQLCIDNIGVVGALIGGGVARAMGDYTQELEKLKSAIAV